MSHIHIPESKLNELARELYRMVGSQAGRQLGHYGYEIAHHLYVKIVEYLDDNDHDYIELRHANSPSGYVLLTYR